MGTLLKPLGMVAIMLSSFLVAFRGLAQTTSVTRAADIPISVPMADQKQTEKQKRNAALNAYKKGVSDRIGAKWYNLVKELKEKVTPGKVVISFDVLPDGRIRRLMIVSATGSELIKKFSMEAVQSARLEPIPRDVLASLPRGRLEVRGYTFTID